MSISTISGGSTSALAGYQALQTASSALKNSIVKQTYGQNFPTYPPADLAKAAASQALLQPQVRDTGVPTSVNATTVSATRGTVVDVSA